MASCVSRHATEIIEVNGFHGRLPIILCILVKYLLSAMFDVLCPIAGQEAGMNQHTETFRTFKEKLLMFLFLSVN